MKKKKRYSSCKKSNVAKNLEFKLQNLYIWQEKKCPSIIIVPGDHEIYKMYSNKLYKLFFRIYRKG